MEEKDSKKIQGKFAYLSPEGTRLEYFEEKVIQIMKKARHVYLHMESEKFVLTIVKQ